MNMNNMMNPFAAFMGNNSSTNPFTAWQNMLQQSTQNMTSAMTTMCGMAAPKATAEPFAFSPLMQMNPLAVMQQSMDFWQSLLNPAAKKAEPSFAPKVTVMTVELGDMSPYIKQATEFMNQWQTMWLQNMGAK